MKEAKEPGLNISKGSKRGNKKIKIER